MFPSGKRVLVNGIDMAVYECGQGAPVILLHGFPELAYSWRHQLPVLSSAGYRVIAPDLRGCGATSKPEGVEHYRLTELLADITGLLDVLHLDTALFIAHDTGAVLAWQLALLETDRVAGLIALNIPFMPRPATDPVKLMRAALGADFYIVDFQDSHAADRLCDEDPARVFEVLMRRGQTSRQEFEQLPRDKRAFSLRAALRRTRLKGEPLLTPEEARIYVEAYSRGGFTPAINWYRNWSYNWRITADVDQTVRVPTLFIGAVDDLIISPTQIEAMRPWVEDLEMHMISDCGHWTQQERPEQLNRLILNWLERRYT